MSFYKSEIETSAALTCSASEPGDTVHDYSLHFVLHCVIITNQSNLTSSQNPVKGISPPPRPAFHLRLLSDSFPRQFKSRHRNF